ncbi:MAG: glycosyltransferase family 4 protein [Methanobacteriota archaeon]
MDRLRIAMLAPEFLPNWGGVGTYCIELARHLSKMDGVDLHVFTVRRQTEVGKGKEFTQAEMEQYFSNKVRVHALMTAKDSFVYNARFQAKLLTALPRFRREHGEALVHSQHAHMSDVLYKTLKPKAWRMPIITTIHTTIAGQRRGIEMCGSGFGSLHPSEKWQVALYPFLRFAERRSLKGADRCITVSEWMKKEIASELPWLKNPVDVIYNGVDPKRYSPEKAKDAELLPDVASPVVLYTSRMTKVKGADTLIQAIPKVLREHKGAHFAFAGSKDNEGWIKMLNDAGVGKDKYSFLGYIPYDQLPALYARASVYAMPTLYENFPFRMLEAMSSGVPVVGSGICGIPEAIENGKSGVLAEPRNPELLADGIISLLGDEKKRRELGARARETVLERFTWGKIAQQTREAYNKLM